MSKVVGSYWNYQMSVFVHGRPWPHTFAIEESEWPQFRSFLYRNLIISETKGCAVHRFDVPSFISPLEGRTVFSGCKMDIWTFLNQTVLQSDCILICNLKKDCIGRMVTNPFLGL